jgi:hypothetical protein
MQGLTREDAIEELREYLRYDAPEISSTDPVSEHRAALENIWHAALDLTDGDPHEALAVAKEAVKSHFDATQETHMEYWERMDAIPSKAFGESLGGADKPQHFFTAAFESWVTSLSTMRYDVLSNTWSPPLTAAGERWVGIVGAVNEEFDESGGGVYDPTDIAVNAIGARFGSALASCVTRLDEMPDVSSVEVMSYLCEGDTCDDNVCEPVDNQPEPTCEPEPICEPEPEPICEPVSDSASDSGDDAGHRANQGHHPPL